jgi:hypothetical protein
MRPLASLAAALVVPCCLAVIPARAQGRPGEALDQVLAGIDAGLGGFASLPFYRYLEPGCVSGTYSALSATK